MRLRKKIFSLLNNWNPSISILLFFICLVASCCKLKDPNKQKSSTTKTFSDSQIHMDTFPIISSKRLEMTRDYALENYDIDDYRLQNPKMIVVHYTAIPSLQKTLHYFKSDSLDNSRKKIIKKSHLNVGVHYVIDKDGSIYNLLPDTIIGRHLIGFNHIALGIENVAKDSTDLTIKQLDSNAKLIKHLSDKFKSIEFLIGHSEYDNEELPHYKFLVAKDASYTPYKKFDPGNAFIEKLRNKVKKDYDLVFKK